MRLIGMTDFKNRAGLASSVDDVMLGKLLESVSARIESACLRTFEQKAYTEVVKPVGRSICVKAYPIDPGHSVTLTDYNFVVPATDFEVDYENGVISLIWSEFTYCHFRSVQVTYWGGYPEVGGGSDRALAVPEDLKDACAKQVKFEYLNRDIFGQQSVSMDGSSVAVAEPKFLGFVQEVIKRRMRLWLE